MKRAAVAAIGLMTGLTMLTGCSKAEVEENNSAISGRRYRRN